MPPRLVNQNVDEPIEHAYLNQELAPLYLFDNSMGPPLSLPSILFIS